MNIIFLSISSLPHMSNHSISLDLIREFQHHGHNVYVVCALEKEEKIDTYCSEEAGCKVLRVKIGKNKQASLIEKGITTLMLPKYYIRAIKKYFSSVKFDLILYPTPPITHVKTVEFLKKRDGAKAFLLLKDIFPQNAIDIGMMSKKGAKCFIYSHFRRIEKKLYNISDYIGCMSAANVDYILKHNPEVDMTKIGISPNSIQVIDMSISTQNRTDIRNKYGIPNEKTVFIYGGNLGKPQGIDFLINCLKSQSSNRQVFFLIVGNGTEYKKIKAFIEEAKPLNVKLVQRLPKEDYDNLVAACDVGMIFLDNRFTIPNFPSRILSYMQARIPVIACTDANTDLGETIEKGRFGFWCSSDNIASFGELVQKCLESDLNQMGDNAFEYLKLNWSVEMQFKDIMGKFDSLN